MEYFEVKAASELDEQTAFSAEESDPEVIQSELILQDQEAGDFNLDDFVVEQPNMGDFS